MKGILSSIAIGAMLTTALISKAHSAGVAQLSVNIAVKSVTCSFDKTSETISLDNVRVADFLNNSGTISKKNSPINITCGSGISTVKIKVNGTPAVEEKGIKASGYFKNNGSAKNVGLNFMDNNGSTLSDGSYVSVHPSAGKASYVFNAGYIALAVAQYVSAGSFIANVNLTFDYQ